MKKHIYILIVTVLSINTVTSAQSSDYSTQLSKRIADKLKDSLTLTAMQRDSIYAINQDIANQKKSIRKVVFSTDSLKQSFQRLEHQRDNMYLNVLGQEKYLLYKSKKAALLNNN